MKKTFLGAFAIIALFAATSCSDDNDESVNEWIDPVFAQVLQDRGYITDAKKVTPLEVANITKVDISGTSYYNRGPVTSVRGIEEFKSLETLNCSHNSLTALDLSKNSQLTSLRCSSNFISSLNISNNPLLKDLTCYSNSLTELNTTHNPELTVIQCDHNLLSSLNVSQNLQLSKLDCKYNPGENGIFKVTTWFDPASTPSNFTTGSWPYIDNGSWPYTDEEVSIEYIKAN